MKKVRPLSLLAALICLLFYFWHLLTPLEPLRLPGNLLSIDLKRHILIVFAAFFFIVSLKPDWYILISLVSMAAGLLNIYDGGDIIGLMLYLFGLAIDLKAGFFRKHRYKKITVAGSIFFLVLAIQISHSTERFVLSLMNISILLLVCFLFVRIFREEFRSYFIARGTINLASYGFTPRQLACLRGSLEHLPLQTIADTQFVSVSVIKKEMQKIYTVFELEDRHDLYELLEQNDLIFPSG